MILRSIGSLVKIRKGCVSNMTTKAEEKKRCCWAKGELYERYHDEEWGVPLHDDRKLFEMLILEGQQAGLSWITILNKRAHMRTVYDDFDPVTVSLYGEEKIVSLMNDPGVIRNRLKIEAAVKNANAFLKIQEEFGSFNTYLWKYTEGRQIKNGCEGDTPPASTPLSDQISKDLKKRGFSFVGTTIIYAFLQAVGVVNDHMRDCYKYEGK